ncbi:MAG: hypothetical protein WCT39_02100 [Candidatus Margulisiibacteriota bacterium]
MNSRGERRPVRARKGKEGERQGRREKTISDRNRIALAYLELAEDRTFQKLPEAKKMELVKQALAIGDETAEQILKEHKTSDPRRIASNLGVKVLGGEKGKGAKYQRNKKEITVYRNFHERLLREVKSAQLSEHLIKSLVAHELFHFLEHSQLGEVYKKFKFESWRIGPYARENYIKGLSDVAAQAFTQTLLGLQLSPQVFNYMI